MTARLRSIFYIVYSISNIFYSKHIIVYINLTDGICKYFRYILSIDVSKITVRLFLAFIFFHGY